MATNLSFCFFIQFLEQLLKFLVNFTLMKYVKSQRSYGFLISKELIFGFQILDLKDHFSASLKPLQILICDYDNAPFLYLACSGFTIEKVERTFGNCSRDLIFKMNLWKDATNIVNTVKFHLIRGLFG